MQLAMETVNFVLLWGHLDKLLSEIYLPVPRGKEPTKITAYGDLPL
jgi:hypothetical protein